MNDGVIQNWILLGSSEKYKGAVADIEKKWIEITYHEIDEARVEAGRF